MTNNMVLTARQKALQINLDNTIYGSFVEIGAGQEVARNFFKAGSASTTIAKTMSAYDRDFSDAIYGKEKDGRYVCKSRLEKMLNHEYELLEKRLDNERHKKNKFFTYADTITTTNYSKTIEGHGWIGLRFQNSPDAKPSDFIIHVILHDQDAKLQQETIGIIGTNLLHACFNETDPKEILKRTYDSLEKEQFEINMVEVIGPAFKDVDNRLLSLTLVKERMTNAVIFTPDGSNQQPSDILHKKNILTMRGSFRPVTKVNIDMLEKGLKEFKANPKVDKSNIQILFEITLSNLKANGEVDERDFLDRADILCSLGYTVMISNYKKFYKIIEYLSQYTKSRMGLILGVDNLIDMFEERYYRNLNGGTMEAFGIIFTRDIRFYLYPYKPNQETDLLNSKNLPIHPRVKGLYNYLESNGRIKDLEYNPDVLSIFSIDVLRKIKACEEGTWEKSVPDGVADLIKEKHLFDSSSCAIE
ncbi:MAG: nicotinate-nucleotide adenylyltransferase [Flavobacteriales bacterium]|nr:nicotinate-nucleotide adenylyltransferase [Flavobacteriales bacterium]|tara:strand:- start:36358 stop:37776 length:1419 start_codon:yes stop_codon:yes gene_type:complete